MVLLELSCLAIVALWVVGRARLDDDPRRLLERLAITALAAWIGEETCILLYGFYSYNPAWSARADRVPLLIALIWPIVIHSARDLARCLLGPRPAAVALLGGAIVLADASLIEPIAVRAGLWSWTEPGLFAVPPIGVLGWAYFAAACIACFELADRGRGGNGAWLAWLVPAIAPLATHALLLASWWGALRWVNGPVPAAAAIAIAWALAVWLAASAWRSGARRRIPRAYMLLRVPAASFFFVLLAVHAPGEAALWAYALAFAPPYLALTAFPRVLVESKS